MDTELNAASNTENTGASNTQPANSKTGSHRYLAVSLLCILFLALGAGSTYLWQHHKVTELNNQLQNDQATLVKDSKLSLDNLNALEALPNVVETSVSSPTDLTAFLGADNTQCYKNNGSGYYKVVAQANDQFAKMQYGCAVKGGSTPMGAVPTYILAKKVNNKWSLISPTNQWLTINGQDLPSCTMVNNNKVSKFITPQCWQGPAAIGTGNFNIKNYSVVPVTNP